MTVTAHLGRRLAACIAAAGMVGALSQAGAASAPEDARPIAVTVRSAAPTGDVRIVISIEPDPENRWLQVEADSPNFFRSTEFSLDGADAARVHSIEWHGLPAGRYELRAVVRGADGRRGSTMRPFRVLRLDSSRGAPPGHGASRRR